MKKYVVELVNANGEQVAGVDAVMVQTDCLGESEILRLAAEQSPMIADALKNEPLRVVYGADGRVANAQEIKNANYVIIIPLV